MKYFYSDESEFRKVFKTISEKVQLLAIEFEQPQIIEYWTTVNIDGGALFLISPECVNASIAYRITKIIKETVS
jgi:hypothetical protein